MCVRGGGGEGRGGWWWWARGEMEGGGVRTSSLPDSDAVRAATVAVLPLEGLTTPPAQMERWEEEKGG